MWVIILLEYLVDGIGIFVNVFVAVFPGLFLCGRNGFGNSGVVKGLALAFEIANFSGTESASEYNLKCTTRFVQCHLHSSSSAGQLCDHQLSIFGAFLRVKTALLQTTGTGAT